MANTAWMTKAASEKQVAFVQKLVDEKQVGNLSEAMQDQIADLASGQTITGGEASALIDALMKAPRKPKPSAGFAPLVSTFPARKAEYDEAQAALNQWKVDHDAAMVAAGGKARTLGRCVTCNHGSHDHKNGAACSASDFHSLGWDDGYNVSCNCKEFFEATAVHDAAWTSGISVAFAQRELEDAGKELWKFVRGDRVVVARGRKIKKGSKGQVIKTQDGAYGWSAFLLLDDGSKAWTALTNIDHEEG